MQNNCNWIQPNWPAPANVQALVTLRQGGYSKGPFEGLNLSATVGDDIAAVQKNRLALMKAAQLPSEPNWLKQVHGTAVIDLDQPRSQTLPEADASFSRLPGQVAVVTTADCLPILLCNKAGTEIAAIHAGWRGLAKGVIEETFKKLQSSPADVLVWLGPAIGPASFVVGDEVKNAFSSSEESLALKPLPVLQNEAPRWLANLYLLAQIRLKRLKVTHIYGGEYCTYLETEKFYSFRRSTPTGRMAALIWIG